MRVSKEKICRVKPGKIRKVKFQLEDYWGRDPQQIKSKRKATKKGIHFGGVGEIKIKNERMTRTIKGPFQGAAKGNFSPLIGTYLGQQLFRS